MTTTPITSCPICHKQHLLYLFSCCDSITGIDFDILQCSDCRLMLTQNCPKPHEMSTFYPQEDCILYHSKPGSLYKIYHWLQAQWCKKRASIVEQEAHRMSGVLLDVGSHRGDFISRMRRRGWIAHGLEHDTVARQWGNTHYGVQAEDATQLFGIKPCSYNVVTAWDSLGEWHDINRCIEQLSKLIVKDGTLIIGLSNPTASDARFYKEQWQGWNVPRKRWHLTPENFEQLISRHNLYIANRRTSIRGNLPYNILSLQDKKGNTLSAIYYCLKQAIITLIKKEENYIIYTLKHQTK